MITTNTHIHSPYSFSCFESIEQAVAQAVSERIGILGLSDFNTVEGFEEFSDACLKAGIVPLFNCEFIALNPEDREKGIRWNDPKNPGLIYFCGKALDFPVSLSHDSKNLLRSIWKGSQDHAWHIIARVNDYLKQCGFSWSVHYETIREQFAKNTVRERHIAKALYHEIMKRFSAMEEQRTAFRLLFADPGFDAPLSDSALMQNEIRNRLLKAGKPAYVREDDKAFRSLTRIITLILDGGGIPCYPVLVDERAGINEMEQRPEFLADTLKSRNIHAVEFIPHRNSPEILRTYVRYFHKRGFCVTFGTEHNTPSDATLVPTTRDGKVLDDDCARIGFEGACIHVAHQQRTRLNADGFINRKGHPLASPSRREQLIARGAKFISQTCAMT